MRTTNNSNEFRPAIIVMAKVPLAGSVKTRLRPFLTDDQCCSLAACFLKDTVSNALKVTPNVIVAFYPPEGRVKIESLLTGEITLVEQKGDDLGERLASAVTHAEALGFGPVSAIGTDSPTLPTAILKTAVESFRESDIDIVLGGTCDGGYYLIGLRKMTPGIFHGISWSSERVYRETIENAKQIGLMNLVELPVWYDVDTPADLVCLRNEVVADETSREQIPATFEWLLAHKSVFG